MLALTNLTWTYYEAIINTIGPSGLRATSGLAEQLRETTIFGIGPSVLRAPA